MQYMLLIYSPPGHWEALSEDEREAIYQDYYKLSDELRERNALVSSHELEGAETARSVRVRDGERLVSDGPFAETKEALGGYYLIEADSLEEAEEWAAKIPSARHGIVEVRPVVMRHAEVGA